MVVAVAVVGVPVVAVAGSTAVRPAEVVLVVADLRRAPLLHEPIRAPAATAPAPSTARRETSGPSTAPASHVPVLALVIVRVASCVIRSGVGMRAGRVEHLGNWRRLTA